MVGFTVLVGTTWMVAGHLGHEPPGAVPAGLAVGVDGVVAQELVGTAVWGQTLGRRLVHLRVVRADTDDVPGWARAAVRAFEPLGVSRSVHAQRSEPAGRHPVFRRSWEGLHDLTAGTLVVDDRAWRHWVDRAER